MCRIWPDFLSIRRGKAFGRTIIGERPAYSLLVGHILHLCYKSKVDGVPETFGSLTDEVPYDAVHCWNSVNGDPIVTVGGARGRKEGASRQ